MNAGSSALYVQFPDHSYKPADPNAPGTLPTEAADLYRTLASDAEDLSVIAESTLERVQLERADVARLQGALVDMEHRYPGQLKGDAEYERTKKMIAAGRDRVSGFTARHGEQSARSGSLRQLVTRIDEWLGQHRDADLISWSGATPKLGKTERQVAAVHRCRALVGQLQAEAAKVKRAPLTSAEAKAAARAYVASLAARARPDVTDLFQGGSTPTFNHVPEAFTPPIQFGSAGATYQGGAVRDATSFFAWLAPGAMLAGLDAEIDAMARDDVALTAETKARRLAEIAGEVLAAERDEEAFLRMALDEGVQIDRRADADPRAVLQIEVA